MKWHGRKFIFKDAGIVFLSYIGWGSYTVSIGKTTACKKIGALIRFMKFLSSEIALYFYKSIIRFCLKYCFHVWAGALIGF